MFGFKLSNALATLSLGFVIFSGVSAAQAASRDVTIRFDRYVDSFGSVDLTDRIPINNSTCGLIITGVSASARNLQVRRTGSVDLVFDGRTVDRNSVIGELGNHYQNLELYSRYPETLCNHVSQIELRNSGGTSLHIRSIVVHLNDGNP